MTSSNASPRVIASKLLGGVDQATLRQSLSSHSNLTAPTDYLSDAEVWLFSDQLRQLESLQMDIFVSDIQVLSVYFGTVGIDKILKPNYILLSCCCGNG